MCGCGGGNRAGGDDAPLVELNEPHIIGEDGEEDEDVEQLMTRPEGVEVAGMAALGKPRGVEESA